MSFGTSSAIVTSVGLIVGFGAANIAKPTIVAGLLIVGLADNVNELAEHSHLSKSNDLTKEQRSEQRLATSRQGCSSL